MQGGEIVSSDNCTTATIPGNSRSDDSTLIKSWIVISSLLGVGQRPRSQGNRVEEQEKWPWTSWLWVADSGFVQCANTRPYNRYELERRLMLLLPVMWLQI